MKSDISVLTCGYGNSIYVGTGSDIGSTHSDVADSPKVEITSAHIGGFAQYLSHYFVVANRHAAG